MTSPDAAAESDPMGRKPFGEDWDYYGLTHQGFVRKTNQDHFLICSLRKHMEVHRTSLPNLDQIPLEGERVAYLAMVADGVGSGAGGGEASRIALEEMAQYVADTMRCYYTADATNEQVFFDALEEAAMRGHASVVKMAEADPERRRMATTLTVWVGAWPHSYLLQVGDSRCYLYGNGKLTQISRDQTMAQELVDQGVLTRSDADNSHWAHVLSSAIGGTQTAPAITRVDQAWNGVGLLCSDGLTKHVTDEQISERLRTMTSAKQACTDLLQDALDDGGTDNITIVVGRVRKEA
jgi:serine/threonine protein phosphatase PrpC